jgi:hypothetical protein
MIDKHTLFQLENVVKTIRESYDYQFFKIFQVNSLLFHCCHAIDTVLCINSQQGSGTGLCTVAIKVTSTQ